MAPPALAPRPGAAAAAACASPPPPAAARASPSPPPPEGAPSPLAALLDHLAEPLDAAFHTPAASEAGDADYGLDAGGAAGGSDEDGWEALDLPDLIGPPLRAVLAARLRARLRLSPRRRSRLVLLRDKLSFLLGSLDLTLSAFCLGAAPAAFAVLYTGKLVALMAARWWLYKRSAQHYYLFDLWWVGWLVGRRCFLHFNLIQLKSLSFNMNPPPSPATPVRSYFSQALVLAHLWLLPASIRLAKVAFALAFGPLLWSVAAFRNSLVFHDLDKTTSLFLHLYPAAVMLASRAAPRPALAAALAASPAAAERWAAATLRDLALLPMAPYCLWAAAYYIKVFVVSEARIAERGYETLFSYVTARPGPLSALVLRAPRAARPAVYMLQHLVLGGAAMSLNALWWRAPRAAAGALVAALAVSAWNGGEAVGGFILAPLLPSLTPSLSTPPTHPPSHLLLRLVRAPLPEAPRPGGGRRRGDAAAGGAGARQGGVTDSGARSRLLRCRPWISFPAPWGAQQRSSTQVHLHHTLETASPKLPLGTASPPSSSCEADLVPRCSPQIFADPSSISAPPKSLPWRQPRPKSPALSPTRLHSWPRRRRRRPPRRRARALRRGAPRRGAPLRGAPLRARRGGAARRGAVQHARLRPCRAAHS
jgi:hypothetical protein